ncbi:MAG TPA: hypothetical protein VGE54_08035 [Brevundimonas sp.]
MPDKPKIHEPRTGPLVPVARDGLVIVHNPPDAPMHLTPDQADISGVRLLDAAEKARSKTPH